MALVKFGGGVSEMRGKEAGIIYSRNAYGSYVKQKVSPVNPQTSFQQDQRQMMGNLAQAWATLDAGEKAAWDNLGAQTTRINRFGDTTNYTGFAMFMKCNRNIVLTGNVAIDAAPVPGTLPTVTISAFACDVSDTKVELTYTVTPIPASMFYFVYLTNNIVTGRRFVKNYYRFIKALAPAAASPQDVYTEWNAQFSNVLVAGAKIFGKVKAVDSTTGFESVPVPIEATVTA